MNFECYFSQKYILIIRNSTLYAYKMKYDFPDKESAVMICELKNKSDFGTIITRDTYTHALLRSGLFAKAIKITKTPGGLFKVISNRGYILLSNNIFSFDDKRESTRKNPLC